METEFLNLGLDIIGLGVFNYEFGSITRESPVIKVGGGRCQGWSGMHYEKRGSLSGDSGQGSRLTLNPSTGPGCMTRGIPYQWPGQLAPGASLQAVYSVLKEAEHRSTFYLPYWDLPLASALVPRQRRFQRGDERIGGGVVGGV